MIKVKMTKKIINHYKNNENRQYNNNTNDDKK